MWTFPTLEPAVVTGGTFVIDRLLSRPGEVVVRVGDQVTPDTIVARSMSEDRPTTLFIASELGVPNNSVSRYLMKKVGSKLSQGETIARARRGLRTVSVPAPASGVLASVDESSGTVVFSVSSGQNQLRALVNGEVERMVPDRGAIIRAYGSRVFGIVGFGTEAVGTLAIGPDRPERELTPDAVRDTWKGQIVVCGMTLGTPALQRLKQAGVAGIIVGSLAEADMRRFLTSSGGGHEIRPAAFWNGRQPEALFAPTSANAPFVIVATEGFGRIPMAEPVFNFLREHQGQTVSIQAATGVGDELRRPELFITGNETGGGRSSDELTPGRLVRVVSGRHLGTVGTCQSAAYQLSSDAGVITTVAEVAMPGGDIRQVPALNLEVLI